MKMQGNRSRHSSGLCLSALLEWFTYNLFQALC